MRDSSSDFRKDFSYGNTFDFGDFERCINIKHNSDKAGNVRGKYCLIQFYSSSNRTIRQGPGSNLFNYQWKKMQERFGGAVCTPSSCTSEVLKVISEELFNGTDLVLATDYDQNDFCKIKTNRWSISTWIAIALLTTLSIVCGLQTYYDIITRKLREEKPKQILIAFSIYTNGRNLFRTDSSERSASSVACLDGIKVLSALSVVAFHSSYHRKFFPLADPRQFAEWEETFASFASLGFHCFVESFFVISGALIARSVLKDLKS